MLKNPLSDAVTVRFFLPSPELQPYISSYYLTEVDLPPGETIEDWMLPEWASLRMAHDGDCVAGVGPQPMTPTGPMMATGPTSFATNVRLGRARIWGVGILPLGWARLVDAPASDYADRFCDGASDPAWSALAPLIGLAFDGSPGPAVVAELFDAFLRKQIAARAVGRDEDRIREAHRTLIDEDIAGVRELSERLGMPLRTLERFSLRTFGFSPKLLLRRQRFTRSLAQFLLDPSLKWINTLDGHYVDQAHFVHDFRRFMGMSPSAYARADHPALRATAKARAAAVGGAVQALHQP